MTPSDTNLTTAAEPVRAALTTVETNVADIEAGQAEHARRVADLERRRAAVDPGNLAELTELVAEKFGLEIVDERTVAFRKMLPAQVEALRPALETLVEARRQHLAAQHVAVVTEAKTKLAVDLDPVAAERAAQSCRSAVSIRMMLNRPNLFEIAERPVETAKSLLAEVDAIISGSKPWLEVQ